jgi:hypothetical protein
MGRKSGRLSRRLIRPEASGPLGQVASGPGLEPPLRVAVRISAHPSHRGQVSRPTWPIRPWSWATRLCQEFE